MADKKYADHIGVFNKQALDFYTPVEMPNFSYESNLGDPGEFPFTRGIHSNMYKGRLWTMRQFAGFGLAKETNTRFHSLLAQGQTGLSVAFDMPTLMGYDPDQPNANGEVGREGVSVANIQDMEVLFEGLDLEQLSVSMTINCTATPILAMYFALVRRRGYDIKKCNGTIQNDILKEYIAQKEWICPPRPGLKLSCDIIEYCTKEGLKFNPINISGYHIREAGATALQELAFTLINGLTYVRECLNRGLDVDSFAPRLSFFWDVHNNFFEEIAKFRAARRLWAKFIKNDFGARNPRSMWLRTHAQTAGVTLTAQQPINNVARVAIQALAAVLGGTQSLHTNSLDETLSLPTEEAAIVALRTQQIIAYETKVTDVVDPLAGSYYIESLTDFFEKEVLKYVRIIEEKGGMLEAILQGFPQAEVAESAYIYQKDLENGLEKIIGVTDYNTSDESKVDLLSIDPNIETIRISEVLNFKKMRNQEQVSNYLSALKDICKRNENVMPLLVDAVDAGVTVGEISQVYRDVYGEYRDPGM